ncbi:uncharacterized protein RJT21DRAFT_122398 [Scheffersomyces amazonensis]|uniref:uncharacterized protein n=1 Tax=Scheffersomyces amazonensis TaxID=1078765 RepID=UPI00315C9651
MIYLRVYVVPPMLGRLKSGYGTNISSRIYSIGAINIIRIRHYSSSIQEEFNKQDIEKARKWLDSATIDSIPTKIFEISYSRSSGPGGQKVNKTSSKATISLEPHQWLNSQFCYWIPKPILAQITSKPIRYETKTGGILIQSDTSRNREINTEECFKKLLTAIKERAEFAGEVSEEDIEKWEQIKEEVNEKRLYSKKKSSDKKKNRSKKFDW